MKVATGWSEGVTLVDGTRARLRPVQPSDAKQLRTAFEHLSPESRRRRFLEAKTKLSDAEIEQLTSLDFDSHVAIGVEIDRPLRPSVPVGIGRYIRLSNDPTTAELALTVADDYQGNGIATIMLDKLVTLAREQGIEHFVAFTLPENEAVTRVLRHCGLEIERKVDDGIYEYILHL